MVVQSIIIGCEEDKIKVINMYETGRFEIATLESNRKLKYPKVIDKKEVRPTDIGNNGALVVKETIPRQFVSYQGRQKDKEKENKKTFTNRMNQHQDRDE